MAELSFNIGDRQIGDRAPCYIIAEVGINHDGDPELARDLLAAAAECGADSVKLQIVDADAAYMTDTASYREFADRNLSLDVLQELVERANRLGLQLFATPGDPKSLETIVRLGMPAVKISSGLMTNTLMLRQAARTGLPLIVSTGMANLSDVRSATETLRKANVNGFGLLHCRSLYPSPPETANLRAIDTLAEEFSVPVGYSDHCLGIVAATAAVARGASLLEKHFTIDPSRSGADHQLSSAPDEFSEMVRQIRSIEVMLGNGVKELVAAEASDLKGRYRYLIAAKPIKVGDVLEENMLAAKRTVPGYGVIPAQDIDRVIGRRLAVSLDEGEALSPEQIEEQ